MRIALRNNQEVAHVWAAQTQSEGKSGHMFFDGPSIFSYGRHFEIARIVKPGIVLFNSKRYSVSTCKHQSYTARACSHMKMYSVPSMTDHHGNAQYYINELENDLYKLGRARTSLEWKRESWTRLATQAVEYCTEFKKEIPLDLKKTIREMSKRGPLPSAKLQAEFKERSAHEREQSRERRLRDEAREAERKAEMEENLKGWLAGIDGHVGYFGAMPVMLRIKDNEIQTTRGASIPVIEGKKLWRAIQAGISVEGMRVGHYTVNGIYSGALVAGCHVIPMAEINRIAEVLHI